MSKNGILCSRVSDDINCPRCGEKKVLKNGTTKNQKQQYYCKNCGNQPIISKGKDYEVDEMRTYIRHKRNSIWLIYALEKKSKNVVSFHVGKRTNKTLSRVLETLKLSEAKKIFTDRTD